jgi:hypothetical protein
VKANLQNNTGQASNDMVLAFGLGKSHITKTKPAGIAHAGFV